MKTSFAKVAGGLALLTVSSVAMASVVDTPHNLGASGGGNASSGTTEICVFCHTPHGGDQTTFAPLWNRATGSTGVVSYTRFSDLGRLTFDAKEAPVGAVSAACLSCHDGTQSMNAVINSPGLNTAGTVGGMFSETSITNSMSDMASANGSWDGTGSGRGDMVYLGTDLSNDHPISMQYGGGGINSGATSGATTDPDFAQAMGRSKAGGGTVGTGLPGGLFDSTGATSLGNPSNAAVGNTVGNGSSDNAVANGSGTGAIVYSPQGGTPRWYVETNGDATFTSKDFPLYTRTDVTLMGGIAEPTVECGTCHDPHSGNSTFLRLVGGNRGSQVCLTCHAK
jgi:predicted CXXCH cytochrome family protein